VWRQRGDHFIGHEELAETEEAARVERAAKRLVDEVKVGGPVCCSTTMCSVPVFDIYSFLQGAMKTVKYRKRCFDQIEGIVAENKALAAEVDRLRSEVGEKVAEMSAQEEHRLELTRRLADQYRQREGQSRTPRQLFVAALVDFANQRIIHVGLEEEVARLRQEKEQLGQELAGALETGRRAGEELGQRNRELSGK
jgi:regulator of replication initiation timing